MYSFWTTWPKAEADWSCAACRVCTKTSDIGNMGEAALVSHAKGKKYQDNQKSASQTASVCTYLMLGVARPDSAAN